MQLEAVLELLDTLARVSTLGAPESLWIRAFASVAHRSIWRAISLAIRGQWV